MKNKKGLIRFGSKSVLLIGALALVFVCTAGGTLAWMFDKEGITNTFVIGDISIDLTESDMDSDENDDTNSYSFTADPTGEDKCSINKDAQVTVNKGSEDCWVFVKVEESDNFSDLLEYEMASHEGTGGWASLDGLDLPDGIIVWYLKAEDNTVDKTFEILKDKSVYVKSGVSQSILDALKEEDYPTLTFSAYAIQTEEIDSPLEAWDKLNQ